MKRIAVLLALLTSFAARATTIVMPTDEQLIRKSPVIVSGTVLSTTPVDRDGLLWTETRVAVTRSIKGQAPQTITIHELGGVEGDRITKIFGAPEFTLDERVLLFLEPAADGGYRVMDLFAGKFGEGQALDGRRLWLRHDTSQDVVFLDANLRPAEPRNIQRDAAGFETFLAERVAGRMGQQDYDIENPVLRSADGSGRIRPDFTLLVEPAIYRWIRFDSGQGVTWHHVGTQPGYSGNGVSELQTAMAAWTSYSEARILYNYGGARPGSGDYNEVYFNDPLSAISGSWNPATGGTVGLGGFNGTGAGATFNAPFKADASHPAGATQATTITSALLTIQDGVSPANSISSTLLAEIIAHEFGHTLGFGHSEITAALMHASVTGLGPSLRTDDRMPRAGSIRTAAGTTPRRLRPRRRISALCLPAATSTSRGPTTRTMRPPRPSTSRPATARSPTSDARRKCDSLAAHQSRGRRYRVYVMSSNAAGTSTQSNTVTFTIVSPPVAIFTMDPSTGVAGITYSRSPMSPRAP